MSNNGLPLYKTQTVPVASAALLGVAGQRRLMGFVIVAGAATGSVEFKDAATDTGSVLMSGSTAANTTSPFVDLTPVGGVMFNTGCFCKPAGTNCTVYCWFD